MIDLAIIGAGPAGLTAAVYALRAGLSVKVFESNIYGGQTAIINTIENYPGFKKITGPEFSQALYEQAESLGAEFVFNSVKSVNLTDELKWVDIGDDKTYAHSVIIAVGLKRRILGCASESKFSGKGLSYCATCDGAFFKGGDVIIVGGGNTALEDALYLSNICNKVTMVVRKPFFRGEQYLVDSVMDASNIDVLFESVLTEIKGGDFVTGAVVQNSDEETTEIPVSGVFIAIGYSPDNEIYRGQIDMDEAGYFIAGETCQTNLQGVYVAGDCRIKPLRQIVTATADGAVAASAAGAFVLKNKVREKVRVR